MQFNYFYLMHDEVVTKYMYKSVAIVLGFVLADLDTNSSQQAVVLWDPKLDYIYKRSFSSDKLDRGHLMSSYQVGPTMFPSNPIAGWSGLTASPSPCRLWTGALSFSLWVKLLVNVCWIIICFLLHVFCFPLVCLFSYVLIFPIVNLIIKRIHVHPKYEFLLRVSVSHLK